MILGSSLIIFLGAFVMILNIIKYFSFSSKFFKIYSGSKKRTSLMLMIYIALLIFFLIGYFIIGFTFFFIPPSIGNYIVSLIFLFGSIFVYIGLNIQIRLIDDVEKSNLEIIYALVATVDARDKNLNGHSQNVASLTMLIYSYLPKKYQKLINKNYLEYAAVLHDIGKLGISENILDKTSSLTDDEYEEIKKHTIIGENILNSVSYFKAFSSWVKYHHERYDGKGYFKLCKDEIPFASRIIAIADTYSAITMKRSYKDPQTYEIAVQILKECRNTQLDGSLVDLFLNIPKEKVIDCLKDVEYKGFNT